VKVATTRGNKYSVEPESCDVCMHRVMRNDISYDVTSVFVFDKKAA
jgi:hypothetical protein